MAQVIRAHYTARLDDVYGATGWAVVNERHQQRIHWNLSQAAAEQIAADLNAGRFGHGAPDHSMAQPFRITEVRREGVVRHEHTGTLDEAKALARACAESGDALVARVFARQRGKWHMVWDSQLGY